METSLRAWAYSYNMIYLTAIG